MYLVAFRTHVWDPAVRDMAAALAARVGRGRFVVLADETRGTLGVEGFELLSHTRDFGRFGLPEYPKGRSLWYNGDYPLYALEAICPGYDHYLMIEFDVAVNIGLDALVDEIVRRELDVVAHQIRPADPGWFWYDNAAANYANPQQALIFFLAVSRRALRVLRDARAADAARLDPPDASWPFCESFVPSVAIAAGLRVANLADFARTENLRFRPQMATTDPRAHEEGTIAHPVLAPDRFLASVIAECRPAEFFDEGSELRRILRDTPFADVAGALTGRLAAERDHRGIGRLREMASMHGTTRAIDAPAANGRDLALCRPARTSSFCSFSYAQDEEIDANGANGLTPEPEHGFHTAEEDDPWWMVDLERECVIDAVAIVNRANFAERFADFVIESSRDFRVWPVRHVRKDGGPVSSSLEAPWVQNFADPFVARYVRVRALARTTLHLRKVAVRGREIDI